LNNITLIPTIKEDIIRRLTLEWVISEEDCNWVKSNVSGKMPIESYGSRITLWSQRILIFAARSWMRLIALDILSIRGQIRCIKI
jgi:hypothetical protein